MGPLREYIIYVDESGTASFEGIDKEYPIFVLNFCLFEQESYLDFVKELKRVKLKFFGHDQIIFHERELAHGKPPFNFAENKRTALKNEISSVIKKTEFGIVTVVLDLMNPDDLEGCSVYGHLMRKGLERVYEAIEHVVKNNNTVVVVESRGKKEDKELSRDFAKICEGQNRWRKKLPFRLLIVTKASNCEGLQLSDLIARPIGTTQLHPERKKTNRAYQIIKKKFVTASKNDFKGEGLIECSSVPRKQKGN